MRQQLEKRRGIHLNLNHSPKILIFQRRNNYFCFLFSDILYLLFVAMKCNYFFSHYSGLIFDTNLRLAWS